MQKSLQLLLIFLPIFVLSQNTDPFDEQMAYDMWELSSLTLCNQCQITAMTCQKCQQFKDRLANVTVIENLQQQIHGFVGLWEDRDILITFRGTDGITNIIQDLTSAVLRDSPFCSNCKVSSTFFTVYSSIRDQLHTVVKDLLLIKPEANLVLTGHSSGAVYAAYAGIDIVNNLSTGHLRRNPIQTRWMYSFGMPRIGNEQLVMNMHTVIPNHYRITHAKDMIPLLPPTFLGFKHTGDEYWYNEPSTSYKLCPYPERKDCINKVIRSNTDDHVKYMGSFKGNCDD